MSICINTKYWPKHSFKALNLELKKNDFEGDNLRKIQKQYVQGLKPEMLVHPRMVVLGEKMKMHFNIKHWNFRLVLQIDLSKYTSFPLKQFMTSS